MEERLSKVENHAANIDNRLTVVESKVQTIDKHLIKHSDLLSKIQEDIHNISMAIAQGKGWVIGILGAGALIYTILDWSIRIFGEH